MTRVTKVTKGSPHAPRRLLGARSSAPRAHRPPRGDCARGEARDLTAPRRPRGQRAAADCDDALLVAVPGGGEGGPDDPGSTLAALTAPLVSEATDRGPHGRHPRRARRDPRSVGAAGSRHPAYVGTQGRHPRRLELLARSGARSRLRVSKRPWPRPCRAARTSWSTSSATPRAPRPSTATSPPPTQTCAAGPWRSCSSATPPGSPARAGPLSGDPRASRSAEGVSARLARKPLPAVPAEGWRGPVHSVCTVGDLACDLGDDRFRGAQRVHASYDTTAASLLGSLGRRYGERLALWPRPEVGQEVAGRVALLLVGADQGVGRRRRPATGPAVQGHLAAPARPDADQARHPDRVTHARPAPSRSTTRSATAPAPPSHGRWRARSSVDDRAGGQDRGDAPAAATPARSAATARCGAGAPTSTGSSAPATPPVVRLRARSAQHDDWVDVSAGGMHTCGVRENGTAVVLGPQLPRAARHRQPQGPDHAPPGRRRSRLGDGLGRLGPHLRDDASTAPRRAGATTPTVSSATATRRTPTTRPGSPAA